MACVSRHADNLEFLPVATEIHVELRAMPNRILARPQHSRRTLADDRDTQLSVAFLLSERASGHDGDLQGLEELRCNAIGSGAAVDLARRYRWSPGSHQWDAIRQRNSADLRSRSQ